MKTLLAITAAILIQGCAPASSNGTARQSSEIQYSDSVKVALAQGIRDQGFNCDKVNLAFVKLPDSYGDVQKLYCKNGQVFRATVRPNNTVTIKPW